MKKSLLRGFNSGTRSAFFHPLNDVHRSFSTREKFFSTVPKKPVYTLPLGTDDFREIIEKNQNFIDKSFFIQEILDDGDTKVRVITRARRFAKSLNMSMLHHFLAAEVNGQPTQHLFKDLKISQLGDQYLEHQGKYPVIFMTLKDIKDLSFEESLDSFKHLMASVYREHRYLLQSQSLASDEKQFIERILNLDAHKKDLALSLKNLSHYLTLHYKQKPWILIDEYDTPLQAAYAQSHEAKTDHSPTYYDQMVTLMRSFLGNALKSNPYVERSVMTGILRIGKESLFSDLNNVKIYTILDEGYSEHFGFTQSEVDEILQKASLSSHAEEIKQWYNGYQVGNTVIYNPYSIVECVNSRGKCEPYWVNTSDNTLLKTLIQKSGLDVKKQMEVLITGGSVQEIIDEKMVFRYLSKSPGAFWSLLLFTGYLKPLSIQNTQKGKQCELSVPNREVSYLLRQIIENWIANGHGYTWYNNLMKAMLNGDQREFSVGLNEILLQIVSYHDFAREPEAFYHGMLLGLLATLQETHEIKSNRESGHGRYDMMIIPKDNEQSGVILEFKQAKSDEKIEESASSALSQIEDKRYDQELVQRGIKKSHKLGIGFYGKRCAVSLATQDLRTDVENNAVRLKT